MQKKLIINNTDINYYETGHGRPVIFIPGWLYTTELFKRNLPAIGKSYRAVSYDPRSHGDSGITGHGNNYGQHGRDLFELIEQTGLQDVILVGWSLGATVAYSYMQQFGTENVAAFVSVDESPAIIRNNDQDWGEGTITEICSLVEMISTDGHMDFFQDYLKQGFTGNFDEDFSELCSDFASRVSANAAALLLADAALRDYRELARQIDRQIPLLHILREDWQEPALRWIKMNQPNAKTGVLGGHLQLYEHAELFNELLLSFLDEISRENTKDAV